jgi:phosphate starvation-inducible protein PhoH
MTMHMLPSYFTTTSTQKQKKKTKTTSLIAAEKDHEKFLKRMGIRSRSSVGSEQQPSKLWVAGSSPAEITKLQTRSSVWLERTAHNGHVAGSSPAGSTNKRSLAQSGSAPALGAGGQKFESSNSDQFYNSSMAKRKENVYTGTEIIGIAQMHKSNAVPVRGKKQAEEIAKMRRG